MGRISSFLQRLGRIRIPHWVVAVSATVILALLVWFVGPLIGIARWRPLESMWPRLLVILLIAASVAGYYAVREILRGRENARMMQELAAAPRWTRARAARSRPCARRVSGRAGNMSTNCRGT